MEGNLRLKHGLIKQSLSPVFFLLIIRHVHFEYIRLIANFMNEILYAPVVTILRAVIHPRFGELFIVIIGAFWIAFSLISIPAFNGTQVAGFESHGEIAVIVEEKRDAAASFLMTFILPLLVDELDSPQKWISYLMVILVVCAVLNQSNLYYQSPLLAFLGYKVFTFKVMNPCDDAGLEVDKEYIGITRDRIITSENAIMWKHIADDVYLVYNE